MPADATLALIGYLLGLPDLIRLSVDTGRHLPQPAIR
jgi:hypothetical protein